MFCKELLVFLTLVISTLAVTPYYSSLPLSKTSNTFTRGNKGSDTTVELYIDLACSDCLNSWPTLSSVYSDFKSSTKFVYKLLPLPYHQFSFLLAKSALAVESVSKGHGDVFNFFDYVFTNDIQGLVYNSVTGDITYNEMVRMISDWVANCTDVTAEDYIDGKFDHSSITISFSPKNGCW